MAVYFRVCTQSTTLTKTKAIKMENTNQLENVVVLSATQKAIKSLEAAAEREAQIKISTNASQPVINVTK